METDLLIGVPPEQFRSGMEQIALGEIHRVREVIVTYAEAHHGFFKALQPVAGISKARPGSVEEEIPAEIETMLHCAELSGTGPMSSVAGLVAEKVGHRLSTECNLSEVVIENGGDLYLECMQDTLAVIQAGDSALSGKLGLNIPAGSWGICTSSGTVGHSFSFGKADAVTVLCESAPLADAWATSLANRVHTSADIDPVLALTEKIPDILGCVVVIGDRVGIRGQFELKPLT
jgi:ApbE superfamily uncharacterized protein (UPF0280 family)